MYYGSDLDLPQLPVEKQSDIDRELGRVLWSQLTHVVILTEQHRIKDKVYKEILDRIAEGETTEDDYSKLSESY